MAARRIATMDDDSAFVVVTFDCNNDCTFCSTHKRGLWKRNPPIGGVFDFVDEAAARGCSYIELGGGEVTVHPKFPELLQRARGRFRTVGILSNGRRFAEPGFARQMVDQGLNRVGISFHGSTAAVHDPLSRAPGAFDETVAGIRALVALEREGAPVTLWVTTTVVQANLGDLGALGGLLRELGVTQWRLKAPHGRRNVFPFGPARPSLHTALETYGEALRVETEDFPLCVLGPWARHSSDLRARPDVGIAGQSVQDRAAVRRERDVPPPCATCAAADRCGRPAPAYLPRFGHGDLRPLSESEARALAPPPWAVGQDVDSPAAAPEAAVSAADLDALTELARARDWGAVREGCERLLAAHPADAELLRLRRMAESHLLSDEARRLGAAGDTAGRDRLLERLREEFSDVL